MTLRADHPLSITRGGPWHHLMRRLHVTTPRGDVRWGPLVLFTWLPVILTSLIPLVDRGQRDPVLVDISVHARFLISLPLLVLAERALERRCRVAMRQFRAGRFAQRSDVDAIIDRTEHLRDSWLVEALLLGGALVAGQAALWGWTSPAGFIHGIESNAGMSVARIWYASISLPIVQFLAMRFLWRWGLWIYALVRLSRLRLATIAIHPDNAAGLAFLNEPVDAFALFVASLASVAGAAWCTQIYTQHATIEMFAPSFFTFLACALLLAFGPMVLFAGHLYRARRRDLPLHAELALTYVRDFKHKWLQHHHTTEPVLGTADIQSLNDLGGGFATTEKTRMIPITARPVILVVLAALIPMLPVELTAMPLKEVVAHLGKALVGGLPI